MEKWEPQLKDMSGSAKKLTEQDHFRKAAVVHILPPSLKDHIITTVGSFKTYPELKREIIRLVDMEIIQARRPGKDDMEIGTMSKDEDMQETLMWLAGVVQGKGKGGDS